jgi:hypothetical protein
VADLGLKRWRQYDFWLTLTLLIFLLWIRLYPHYLGQWLYLRTLKVPVEVFTAKWYTVELIYSVENLTMTRELFVVVFGPFANLFFFACACAISWVAQVYIYIPFPV